MQMKTYPPPFLRMGEVLFSSMFFCLSVSLSVCLSVNIFTKKTTEQICMKFRVWLQCGLRKKQLTFGGDPNPDQDSAAGLHCFCFFLFCFFLLL